MRTEIDADAERTDLRRRLEHANSLRAARRMDGQRQRQPADAAADNDDVHRSSLAASRRIGRSFSLPARTAPAGVVRQGSEIMYYCGLGRGCAGVADPRLQPGPRTNNHRRRQGPPLMLVNDLAQPRFRPGRDRRHAARQRARLRRRQDRAARRRDRPQQHVPARSVAAARRARRARHHGRGGVGRRRARLSRALRRDGGNLARVRLGRPVLRRAFEPLRQPDPPQRQRRAEAPLSAEADLRRSMSARWRCRSPAPAPTWCR